jgi:predicted acyl esterase
MNVRMDLLPTSWLFRAGHRIRLAVGGADADNFVMVPSDGPEPTFILYLGGDGANAIDLPELPRRH